jgi:hypothetical protein
MDLDCHRVQPVFPGDPIQDTCNGQWAGGNIYGFGIGAAAQLLGFALGGPGYSPGTSEAAASLLGEHWRYPATGLAERERAIFAASHFFPGSHDAVGPIARLVKPASGAEASGIVSLEGGATDNYGLKSVSLFIDGTAVDEETHTPFQDDYTGLSVLHDWDTGQVATGLHTVEIRAEDTSGNTAQASVKVTVKR